jgi:hypothetical protein
MLRKIFYLIPFAMLLLPSCKKDFLDINTDPNNPTSIEVSKLLPTAQRNLGDALALGGGNNGGLSQILAVYSHQVSTREEADQYGATGTEFFLGLAWPKIYAAVLPSSTTPEQGVMQNLEDIIKNASEAGNTQYAGIAKIMKAYTYSQLVDVFGDVPFSEANKLKEGITYPKFDDDAAIYPQLFTLLDEGIADLNNSTAPNVLTPGSDDLIYGGDIEKWVKAANTIKLKLYTQTRLVQDVSAQVNALLNAGDQLISATDESFLIPYGAIGATDDRNPGFEEYYSTQRSNHISPWFYEILKGYNTRILNNNPDPRLPYYIYNQLDEDQATREGNQTEYRDGPFVSIYFGSVGPDRDRTQQNSISVLGIYPVGGKYDDQSAQTATAASGTGAAPYRMITYADRLYLEAELMKVGLRAGDVRAKLKEAMEESFKQVDYVVTQHVKPAQSVPALSGTAAVITYINKALAEYDAKPAQQLEIIMTQKWISQFGSAVDQYTDIRRTGYPTLFDPANPTMAPGGRVQPPIDGDPVNPGAQKSVPVQISRQFPLSLPWFQGELETNPNAPPQKSPSTYKVFWIP